MFLKWELNVSWASKIMPKLHTRAEGDIWVLSTESLKLPWIKLTLNHWNESFLKPIPSCFMLTSTLAYCRPLVGLFTLVWMKMQIHSLPLDAAFGAVHISVSPVKQSSTALTNTALSGLQARRDENEINHSRLTSRKEVVWKNELFGSRWVSKVKINAHYKKMKVFFDLACMSTCCWGLPKPKYEPFITNNRGTLIFLRKHDRTTVFTPLGDHLLQLFPPCVSQAVCSL